MEKIKWGVLGTAGIARSHLAMIENGTKNANTETLWRVSWALGMPLSALMVKVEQILCMPAIKSVKSRIFEPIDILGQIS